MEQTKTNNIGNQEPVTNHNENSGLKRKRVSRACDRCRAKKDKCDGNRPTCSACMQAGERCLYDPSTKKRGLPEGYVRGLEKLWALAAGKIDGLDDAVGSILTNHRDDLLELWNHESIGDDLHSTWKETRIQRELEVLLTALEPTETGQKRRRETDDAETVQDVSSATLYQKTFHISPGLKDEETSQGYANMTPSSSRTVQRPQEVVSQVILPPDATDLLDEYFSYTSCWLPIVERHRVLRACYASRYAQTSKMDDHDRMLLWAILAYMRQQKPAAVTSNGLSATDSDAMVSYVESLLPKQNSSYMLQDVQALLHLVLLDIGLGRWRSAWFSTGRAVRAALEVGLNTSAEARSKAVFLACFVFDTLVAAHLLRVPHLRRSEVEECGLLEEDGPEEWGPWMGASADAAQEPAFAISCFNRLVEVVLFINDVLCNKSTGAQRLNWLQEQEIVLTGLPASFPQTALTVAAARPPHHTYLRLIFLSARICLSRQYYDGGSPENTLVPLCHRLLTTLDMHAQAYGHKLAPPLLESAVFSGCYAAISAAPSFKLQSAVGLPSYNDFAKRMTAHAEVFASQWPVFRPLTKLWQKELAVEQPSHHSSSPAFARRSNTTVHGHAGSVDRVPSINDQTQSVDLSGYDVTMSALDTPMPPGMAMPVSDPSPVSLQGDDIDAFFYNLAHLDTGQWTNNREQGLQDFGFADESTFQAFCDDPERLNGDLSFNQLGNSGLSTSWPPPGFFPGYFRQQQPLSVDSVSHNETDLQARNGW